MSKPMLIVVVVVVVDIVVIVAFFANFVIVGVNVVLALLVVTDPIVFSCGH